MLFYFILTGIITCFACDSGSFLEDTECIPCEKRWEKCISCTKTRCLECEESYFLYKESCIKGNYATECSNYKPSVGCSQCIEKNMLEDPKCEFCFKYEETCSKCESACLLCSTTMQLSHPVHLRIVNPSHTNSEYLYNINFLELTTEQVRCLVRNLQDSIVRSNEDEETIRVFFDIPLNLHEGSYIQIAFDDYKVEIDLIYSFENPSSYVCYYYDHLAKDWAAGCSILGLFADYYLKQAVNSSDLYSSEACHSYYFLLVFPLVLLLILIILMAFSPKAIDHYECNVKDSSIRAYTVSEGTIRADESEIDFSEIEYYHKKFLESPETITVINYEELHDSSIFEDGFCSQFLTHHLVLGQLKLYFYSGTQRHLLLLLNAFLNIFAITLMVKVQGFPPSLSHILTMIAISAAGNFIILLIIESVLNLFLDLIINGFLVALMLGLYAGSIALVLFDCANFGANWFNLCLLCLLVDWSISQSIVSLLKCLILILM